MDFRQAALDDIGSIVALSIRVQEWLNAAGIAQEMGPIARDAVAAQVAAGTAQVLVEDDALVGSLFLKPVGIGAIMPGLVERLARSGGAEDGPRLWSLQKFMVDPTRHRQGLGRQLLDHAKLVATCSSGDARIVLDCWAGNTKLRAYYAEAGFRLCGIAPVQNYEVAVFVWDADRRPRG